jgi:hypothetical protein
MAAIPLTNQAGVQSVAADIAENIPAARLVAMAAAMAQIAHRPAATLSAAWSADVCGDSAEGKAAASFTLGFKQSGEY